MNQVTNASAVTFVLLPDGWHDVLDQSFTISMNAYDCGGQYLPPSNASSCDTGIAKFGFRFETSETDNGPVVSMRGPLSSILATITSPA